MGTEDTSTGADGKKILVTNLVTDMYNPFAASAEELLAMALDEAGLIGPSTTIGGKEAGIALESFFQKRSHYREISKLGNLLVRQGALSEEDLHRALALQRKSGGLKLGEVMLELGICSVDDIMRNLDTQVLIRRDMEDLEVFRKKIDSIKERLRAHF